MKNDSNNFLISDVVEINASLVSSGTVKGLPSSFSSKLDYCLHKEEVSLPCATLKMSAINNNIGWMQTFANKNNVLLSPHIKTSLAPWMVSKQISAGAWGVTVATIQQAYVAKQCGAKHIILANQLIGRSNFELALALLKDNQCRLFICVDSIANAEALNQFLSSSNQSMEILVEVGVNDGRCGVRSRDDLNELILFVNQCSHLSLQGIEFYEGAIHSENEVQDIESFLRYVADIALECLELKVFSTASPIISGAGSAFYDLVVQMFNLLPNAYQKVIRPGCYVTHDTGIYSRANQKLRTRVLNSNLNAVDVSHDLMSAIEVWGYVQSRPETQKVIINIGKRDVAFDTDLPKLEKTFRKGVAVDSNIQGVTTTAIMDQHMFLKVPVDCTLEVGDIVVFSTSHPCITLDKWRYLTIIDDSNKVLGWIKTEF